MYMNCLQHRLLPWFLVLSLSPFTFGFSAPLKQQGQCALMHIIHAYHLKYKNLWILMSTIYGYIFILGGVYISWDTTIFTLETKFKRYLSKTLSFLFCKFSNQHKKSLLPLKEKKGFTWQEKSIDLKHFWPHMAA